MCARHETQGLGERKWRAVSLAAILDPPWRRGARADSNGACNLALWSSERAPWEGRLAQECCPIESARGGVRACLCQLCACARVRACVQHECESNRAASYGRVGYVAASRCPHLPRVNKDRVVGPVAHQVGIADRDKQAGYAL